MYALKQSQPECFYNIRSVIVQKHPVLPQFLTYVTLQYIDMRKVFINLLFYFSRAESSDDDLLKGHYTSQVLTSES